MEFGYNAMLIIEPLLKRLGSLLLGAVGAPEAA